MKSYLAVTGIIFLLVAIAHVLRIVQEGWGPSSNPWFIGSTLLSVSLSIWAWRLFLQTRRQ